MLEPLDFSCLTLIEGHCHVFSMFPAAFCPPAAWWPAGGGRQMGDRVSRSGKNNGRHTLVHSHAKNTQWPNGSQTALGIPNKCLILEWLRQIHRQAQKTDPRGSRQTF